ncbi:YitT family protein [bacterium]|nr:YitT family protein [bacterium]
MKTKIKNEIKNVLLVTIGVLAAGMGIKGFLLSSNFIDGGVTGVSMLLAKISSIPLFILLPLINLPFIATAYKTLGRAFAIRSICAIGALAFTLAAVPYPDVTPDLLLTAIFGGVFIGAGIAFAMRGGAVLDGTEIAALLISSRFAVLRVGDVILLFNVCLFLLAISTLGVNEALYSILTYFAAAKTLDFVLYGIDEYTAITVISERNTEIRERITIDLKRGATIYKGYGGMSGVEQNILHCVITRLEIGKVKHLIKEVDPQAFLFFHPLSGVEGGVMKSKGIIHHAGNNVG